MSVTLPPELVTLLSEVGEQWPQADEDRLCDLAATWRTASADLRNARDQAASVARAVSSAHHGATIDAFTAHWEKVDRHLEMGVLALDQTAVVLEAMATATVTTKAAIVDVLAAGHQKRTEVRQAGGSVAFIGTLISFLLRMLARVLGPLVRQLWNVVVRHIGPLFRPIRRFWYDIVEFFGELFSGDPTPPPPPPPLPPPEPVYRRDAPLPHARELIKNGEEWNDPGQRNRKLPLQADPNSVLYLRNPPGNGNVSCYTVYDDAGHAIKRVDLDPNGSPHGKIPPPHVIFYKVNSIPGTDEQRVGPIRKSARAANPEETLQ